MNPEEPEKRQVALNYDQHADFPFFKSFLEKNIQGGEIVVDSRQLEVNVDEPVLSHSKVSLDDQN